MTILLVYNAWVISPGPTIHPNLMQLRLYRELFYTEAGTSLERRWWPNGGGVRPRLRNRPVPHCGSLHVVGLVKTSGADRGYVDSLGSPALAWNVMIPYAAPKRGRFDDLRARAVKGQA